MIKDLAKVCLEEIEEAKDRSHGSWNWSKTIPEKQYSSADLQLICTLVGCWYRFDEDGNIRLYTNQNHERHQRIMM